MFYIPTHHPNSISNSSTPSVKMSSNISEDTYRTKVVNKSVDEQPLSPVSTEKRSIIKHDFDDIDSVDGEVPTEEEFHTLRRVSDKVPWRVYTIALVELCERFSFYGTTVVCKS